MDVDGTILIRFSDKIKGVIRTSQIATGEENNFTVAIYGKKGGLKWEQQNPNYLYHLSETDPMKVLKPGHDYNSNFAKISAKFPIKLYGYDNNLYLKRKLEYQNTMN